MPSFQHNHGFASDVELQNGEKFNRVMQRKYFLWTMTSNSLTENEEHDIPSQSLKTTFELHPSIIFRPQYVWFLVHL